ncbi:Polycystic kidney disease protein 1-like 2 [Heterocephalus glaber]|uniref:Polycystic kidney disease protein 1-like 2 n=1 Tax=Heterocephalus glaber TaxID=10181 RepID=G5B1X4_HETGA|nr:Polycystic kidney disease protein 1-like 2 [Heterocephalus glaber]
MNLITSALHHAWGDISGFIIVILVMLLPYSIAVLDSSPVLGSFLIGSCVIFMTFVVLNLFISVILVAFSEEQKRAQLSEEAEIVDLLLMKILSFLGIQCKREVPQSGPEQPLLPFTARCPGPAQASPGI